MESSQQARIRRLQDTLIIAGSGVIAFAAWPLVKTALFFTHVDGQQLMQVLGLDGYPPEALYYTTIVLLCVDLAVRAFVGLSARAEGQGKKKSPFYLVVAVLAAITNGFSAIATALGAALTFSYLDMVVSVVVEVTAFAALAAVVYCSIRLRILNKATD